MLPTGDGLYPFLEELAGLRSEPMLVQRIRPLADSDGWLGSPSRLWLSKKTAIPMKMKQTDEVTAMGLDDDLALIA